jgi:Protein of unknown function (DUF1588)/Protein of unknown function (DUF1592)/Protein of unknown function (DUF1585)
MVTNRASFAVVAILTLAAAAVATSGCGRSTPLGDPSGGAGVGALPGNGAMTGAAGATTGAAGATTASPGATGAAGAITGSAGAGTTGAAGSTTGAAGTAPANAPLPISPQEALNRTASLLWNDALDGDLLTEAAMGQIKTTGDLASIVRGMLADPRAVAGVGAFYRQWLDLPAVATFERDPTLFPAYTPELQAAMADETETFGINVTLTMKGTYQLLMTAPFTFMNAPIGDIYGVSGLGSSFQEVPLPPTQRAGLLTQPALQVLGAYETRTSPATRGTYIASRILCEAIPFPPAGLSGLDPIPPGVTVRAQETSNVANEYCQPCHVLIDPFGFAFEGFDAIGRARTTDNSAPVDVSGLKVRFPNGDMQTLDGPVELANAIANAPDAENCFAQQWLSFALGRALVDADQPALAQIQSTFRASTLTIEDLIVLVLTSEPFLAPGNGLQ